MASSVCAFAVSPASATSSTSLPARGSGSTPLPWSIIPQDVVVKDGDVIRLGGNSFGVLETPGHTPGTASYTFDVKDGANPYRAVTVGGLGLNAIKNSKQVE